MDLKEKALRETAWDLTAGVLRRVRPEALRFDKKEVQRAAFPPDVLLGKRDENLLFAGAVLRLLDRALRTLDQREVLLSSFPEELADNVVKRVQTQAKSLPDIKQMTTALWELFKRNPSILVSIFEGFLPLMEPKALCDPVEILGKCVLKIIDPKGRVSTGFAVSSDGYIVTANHVVESYEELEIELRYPSSAGKRSESSHARVVHADRTRDVAVLQVEGGEWNRFRKAGLTPPTLSFDWQPRDWVLCIGYQEQDIFADPVTVEAFIKPWDPVSSVKFRDGLEQECLVLVIPRDNPAVVPGMSGGPILNLRTCQVIAMVTGATREAWVRQRWEEEDIWESISSARYGFATPLSDVAKSWPKFASMI